MTPEEILQLDRACIWHPYTAQASTLPIYPVESARGCQLTLSDGRVLIDGMSSWWSVIHGYNHPLLNQAIQDQLQNMAHVMFGGLTHKPAVKLASRLVEITPTPLRHVFFSDSGSVAIEVAMKMALQYWQSLGKPERHRFMALRGGYHGDTFLAMSVSDPETGMHHLFRHALPEQLFLPKPTARFHETACHEDLAVLRDHIARHQDTIAAILLEPIVQGAGGMWFYSPDYLKAIRQLCNEYGILLIADEIATGFGRTGKLFACEHANISPDILCLGKALTGGYMTLAATLCTEQVSRTVSTGEAGALMHGPTFMANPLACCVASASIDLLLSGDWQTAVTQVESGLRTGLACLTNQPGIADVRVLGAIGVVELENPVDMAVIQPLFVEAGIWVRPFGRLVYLMPPFSITGEALSQLTAACVRVVMDYINSR